MITYTGATRQNVAHLHESDWDIYDGHGPAGGKTMAGKQVTTVHLAAATKIDKLRTSDIVM